MQHETQESAWLYEALAWLELHRKQLIAGAVLLLLLIVLTYIYIWSSQQKEARANQALLSLRALPADDATAAVAGPGEFLRVAEDFASSSAAQRARLLAAGRLFSDGKYAEAQVQFEKLLADDDDSLIAPIAALGVAASLDAQNKVEAALAAYQKVITDYPNGPEAARAKLAMAALYESRNEPKQALKLYDELTSKPAATRTAMDAAMRREALLKQHPELIPTNAPLAAPARPAVGTNAAAAPALTNAPTATNAPAEVK